MKKNKIINILSILLFTFIILTSFTVNSFAIDINVNEFDPSKASASSTGTAKVKNVVRPIIGTLQTIGIVIAVITIIVIGLKYMTGSVAEKAEYKKTMIPYIIGVILIVAITQLVGLVATIVDNVSV